MSETIIGRLVKVNRLVFRVAKSSQSTVSRIRVGSNKSIVAAPNNACDFISTVAAPAA